MQNKPSDPPVVSQPQRPRPSRQARMHALLFGGAALGTTVLMAMSGPIKFPDFFGD